jgi:hypothetical protein
MSISCFELGLQVHAFQVHALRGRGDNTPRRTWHCPSVYHPTWHSRESFFSQVIQIVRRVLLELLTQPEIALRANHDF